jgi:hypothetical protein
MRAKAMLELMLMEKRTGKYTKEQIAEQEAILLSLQNFNAETIIPQIKPTVIEITEKKAVVELTPEIQNLVDSIKAEMNAIDDEKNELANRMVDIPDNINCADIVEKIKALRKKWTNKNDEFWYVKTHGEMPEVQSVERKIDLPVDKYELNKILHNTRSNLSKYRAKLRDSKTEVKKQHYQKQIRMAENLISDIDLKMTNV